MKVYDAIISLGENCACAEALRRCGFRSYAYCFDWIRKKDLSPQDNDLLVSKNLNSIPNGDLSDRVDLICNDFENYFNYNDFINLGTQMINAAEHCRFINKRTGLEYLHDFFVNQTFDEQFEKVKEHHYSRIKRFYKKVSESENILFVYFSREDNISEDTLINLHKRLKNKFSRTNIDFMYFANNENFSNDDFSINYLNNNITKIIFNYVYPVSTETNLDILLGNTKIYYPILKEHCFSKEIQISNMDKVNWIKFLEKSGEQKYLDDLAQRLKNKKIVLYGAGLLTGIIFEKFDLSKLNIIGVCDKKFNTIKPNFYKGYKTYRLCELDLDNIDIILLSLGRYKKITDYLITSGINKDIIPILNTKGNEHTIFNICSNF